MKERGIPYSAPMVRARRAGIKTMTRQAVKCPIPIAAVGSAIDWERCKAHPEMPNPTVVLLGDDGRPFTIRCPYGQPGDWLWVREAFRFGFGYDDLSPAEVLACGIEPSQLRIHFEADGPAPNWSGRYRHARFMPRALSRGLDEIVAVRVERLQEISEADAVAEGVHPDPLVRPDDDFDAFHRISAVRGDSFPIARYAALWESINGPGSWDANPWVWVIEFRRIT